MFEIECISISTVMPMISIIVPIYKAESYLKRCVDSVLSQTYKNIEVILVDDGSPDRCGKICDEYVQKDKRVQVLHQINLGVSQARNNGIQISNGHYIAFVDSDDYIAANMLEILYNYMEVNNLDFAFAEFELVGNVPTSAIKMLPLHRMVFDKPYDMVVYFLNAHRPGINSPWGRLYKNSIVKQNNILFPTDINLGEDLLFNLNYYFYCNKVGVLPDVVYFYEYTADSLSKKHREDLMEIYFYHHEARKQFFSKLNKYDIMAQELVCSTFFCNIMTAMEENVKAKVKYSDFAAFYNNKIVGKFEEIFRNVKAASSFHQLIFLTMKLKNPFFVFVLFRLKFVIKKF